MDDRGTDAKPPEEEPEFVPPKDGSWIPRERLNEESEAKRKAELKAAELEGRLQALESQKAKPKEFTRAELQDRVERGEITQSDMDRLWESQLERRIKNSVKEEVLGEADQKTVQNRVSSEIDKYKEAQPNIMKSGSEERKRVESEFNYLVQHGHDSKSLHTELAAIRAALGPISRVGKPQRETHQESGGDTYGEEEKTSNVPKGLSNAQKRHYAKMIDDGMYKGWDDPKLKKEMEFVRKRA